MVIYAILDTYTDTLVYKSDNNYDAIERMERESIFYPDRYRLVQYNK